MVVAGPIEAALVSGHPRSNICGPVGYTLHDSGSDGLGGAVKQGRIVAVVNSRGDDWPDEEIKAIKEFFEGRGYVDTASGSGGPMNGVHWWAVQYELKVDEDK